MTLPQRKVTDREVRASARLLDHGESLPELTRHHLSTEGLGERSDPVLDEVRHWLFDLDNTKTRRGDVPRVEVRVDRVVVGAFEVLVILDRRAGRERHLLREFGPRVAEAVKLHPEVAVVEHLLRAVLRKETPDDGSVGGELERRVSRRHLLTKLAQTEAHEATTKCPVGRIVYGTGDLAHRVRRARRDRDRDRAGAEDAQHANGKKNTGGGAHGARA